MSCWFEELKRLVPPAKNLKQFAQQIRLDLDREVTASKRIRAAVAIVPE